MQVQRFLQRKISTLLLSPALNETFRLTSSLSLSSSQVSRLLAICSGAALAWSSFSAFVTTTLYHLSARLRLACGLVAFLPAFETPLLFQLLVMCPCTPTLVVRLFGTSTREDIGLATCSTFVRALFESSYSF
jgi:hypothetical protein